MTTTTTPIKTYPIIKDKANSLNDRIIGTNNGYLFCPTAEEVYLATQFPDRFSITYAPLAKEFPFRITLIGRF